MVYPPRTRVIYIWGLIFAQQVQQTFSFICVCVCVCVCVVWWLIYSHYVFGLWKYCMIAFYFYNNYSRLSITTNCLALHGLWSLKGGRGTRAGRSYSPDYLFISEHKLHESWGNCHLTAAWQGWCWGWMEDWKL
jgi:hypothetical protein